MPDKSKPFAHLAMSFADQSNVKLYCIGPTTAESYNNHMQLLFILLGVSVAINTAMFLVAYRYKTDRLTDISYALSFIVLVATALFLKDVTNERLIVAALVVGWAIRLGTFLLIRIWHIKVDHRFDDMRNSFSKFGKFWELQAVSVWVILIPSLLALSHASVAFTAISYVGCGVWAVGLVLEAVADVQKYRFNQNKQNAGKWIDQGIWHYSRHPNYMGEMLVWVGIYLVVFATLTTAQALVGLVGPLFITCLLLFVSGIPPLERGADKRWGDDPRYRAYKRRTSVLIPLPTRK